MDKPRPEGTTLVIMVSPVPGKYEALQLCLIKDNFFYLLNFSILWIEFHFKMKKSIIIYLCEENATYECKCEEKKYLSLFQLLCKEPQKFNENSLNAARHGNL